MNKKMVLKKVAVMVCAVLIGAGVLFISGQAQASMRSPGFITSVTNILK